MGNAPSCFCRAFVAPHENQTAARLLPEIVRCAPSKTTEYFICRANGETGATGLEPATSGVTGQFDGARWTTTGMG
jgi:hypothetical protein